MRADGGKTTNSCARERAAGVSARLNASRQFFKVELIFEKNW